jgi:hypothetical protein
MAPPLIIISSSPGIANGTMATSLMSVASIKFIKLMGINMEDFCLLFSILFKDPSMACCLFDSNFVLNNSLALSFTNSICTFLLIIKSLFKLSTISLMDLLSFATSSDSKTTLRSFK